MTLVRFYALHKMVFVYKTYTYNETKKVPLVINL